MVGAAAAGVVVVDPAPELAPHQREHAVGDAVGLQVGLERRPASGPARRGRPPGGSPGCRGSRSRRRSSGRRRAHPGSSGSATTASTSGRRSRSCRSRTRSAGLWSCPSPASWLATSTAPPTALSAAAIGACFGVRCARSPSVCTMSASSVHTPFKSYWTDCGLVSTATGLAALFIDPWSVQSTESAWSGLSGSPFWSTQRPSQPVAGLGSSSPACQNAREWKWLQVGRQVVDGRDDRHLAGVVQRLESGRGRVPLEVRRRRPGRRAQGSRSGRARCSFGPARRRRSSGCRRARACSGRRSRRRGRSRR